MDKQDEMSAHWNVRECYLSCSALLQNINEMTAR
jgi:hypothetical protein